MLLSSWLWSLYSALRSGNVDFHGQDKAQTLLVALTALGGFGGFFVGAFLHDFNVTVYIILASLAFASLLCIPSWPLYQRHPVAWTPHDPQRLEALYSQQQMQQKHLQELKQHGKKQGSAATAGGGKGGGAATASLADQPLRSTAATAGGGKKHQQRKQQTRSGRR